MVLVLVLVWSGLLVRVCWTLILSSVGQQLLSSMGQQSLSSVGQQRLSSVGTPPSVVILLLNWLVWSVVKLWVERFLDPFSPINELIFGLGF
jgi:nitric oxide reductase large subunit